MAKNEVDSAIQRLLKLGIKVTKLWENASPTSAFAEQTIRVAWNGWDFMGVVFPETGLIEIPTKSKITTFRASASGGLGSSSGYLWVGYRTLSLVDGGLKISNMANKYANSQNLSGSTGSLIPIIIYGIKLLGGGKLANAIRRYLKGGVCYG